MPDQSGMMGQQPPMPWDLQPPPVAPLQPGQQSTPMTQSMGRLIGKLLGPTGTPEQRSAAMDTAIKINAIRQGLVPKYGMDPTTGVITGEAPGMVPSVVGHAQVPGTFKQEHGDPYGMHTYFDPYTGYHMRMVMPEAPGPQDPRLPQPSLQQPSAPIVPPVPNQKPPITNTAPVNKTPIGNITKGTPNMPLPALGGQPPTGMMGAEPPAKTKFDPSEMVASVDKYFVPGGTDLNRTGLQAKPEVIAQMTPGEGESAPNDPPVDYISGLINNALKEPSTIGKLPNEPKLFDYVKNNDVDSILKYRAKYKNWLDQASDKGKKDLEDYAKTYQSLLNGQEAADAMRPEIHIAKAIPDTKYFTGGPLANIVTGLRAGIGQIGELASIPGMAEWATKANPNQIFTKIGSESVLRGLRQTLGPDAGRFMQREIDLLERARASTLNTPGASKSLLEMMDKINDRASLLGRMARRYHNERGTLDDGFTAATQKLALQHPTFTKEEEAKFIKDLESDTIKPSQKVTPQTQSAPQTPQAPQRRNPILQLLGK